MKILMLGWEYPPFISGGLGTACEGLTTGLARHNLEILFVVPHFFGGEKAPHMTLVDSSTGVKSDDEGVFIASERSVGTVSKTERLSTVKVPALLSPYWTPETYQSYLISLTERRIQESRQALFRRDTVENLAPVPQHELRPDADRYGRDIFGEVTRFTENVVEMMAGERFDAIHAHDWMTYPAGVALSKLTGKPLIVHVHSLEFDRSGTNVNQQINEIEKWGLQSANAVIAVSYYTRSVISREHGVPLENIHVVHNGIYPKEVVQRYRGEQGTDARIVLFLGRITFQKGPDYFVEAAAKVIPHVPNVLFVMAGAGDMLQRMIDRVHQLGIEKHFHFPGFLKGQEVEQVFSLADVYVMPSVSEPFGISALEAISFDTPVIISRQSGVAEVLGHALKVDFWDVDRLADLIINALVHEELRADMVSMAREELKRLRWDAAALKTIEIYRTLV